MIPSSSIWTASWFHSFPLPKPEDFTHSPPFSPTFSSLCSTPLLWFCECGACQTPLRANLLKNGRRAGEGPESNKVMQASNTFQSWFQGADRTAIMRLVGMQEGKDYEGKRCNIFFWVTVPLCCFGCSWKHRFWFPWPISVTCHNSLPVNEGISEYLCNRHVFSETLNYSKSMIITAF